VLLCGGGARLTVCAQAVIDRKFEPLVNRLMRKYLGELEDDDLVLFVLEHLKDHKAPQKLVDGLEPVRALPTAPPFTADVGVRRCWRRTRRSSRSRSGARSSSRARRTARACTRSG
jgi:hypothetical protein